MDQFFIALHKHTCSCAPEERTAFWKNSSLHLWSESVLRSCATSRKLERSTRPERPLWVNCEFFILFCRSSQCLPVIMSVLLLLQLKFWMVYAGECQFYSVYSNSSAIVSAYVCYCLLHARREPVHPKRLWERSLCGSVPEVHLHLQPWLWRKTLSSGWVWIPGKSCSNVKATPHPVHNKIFVMCSASLELIRSVGSVFSLLLLLLAQCQWSLTGEKKTIKCFLSHTEISSIYENNEKCISG